MVGFSTDSNAIYQSSDLAHKAAKRYIVSVCVLTRFLRRYLGAKVLKLTEPWANAPKPPGEVAPEPKALRLATELPVPQAAAGSVRSPGSVTPSTSQGLPEPSRPSHTPRQIQLVQGLKASRQSSISNNKKPRARPSPNLAPARSRQVPENKCKNRTAIRANFQPVQVEARVERQRGWAHAGPGARLGASSTGAPPH